MAWNATAPDLARHEGAQIKPVSRLNQHRSAFMCCLYVGLDTFEAAELERRLRGFR
jgi:hypothetical protein